MSNGALSFEDKGFGTAPYLSPSPPNTGFVGTEESRVVSNYLWSSWTIFGWSENRKEGAALER